MKTPNKWSVVLIILAAILFLLSGIQTCRNQKYAHQNDEVIDSLQLANQKLDSTLNRNKQIIYQQDVIVTSNQSTIESLTDSIFDLKRKDDRNRATIAYYKNVTSARVTEVDIPYLDSIAMKRFSDSVTKQCAEVIAYMQDSMITVPRYVEDSNKNYTFSGEVKKNSFHINHLVIPDTLQLRFVEHKGGLFRRKSVEIQYFHSNPLVQNISSNSVIYKAPSKPRWLERAIIAAASIYIGSKL